MKNLNYTINKENNSVTFTFFQNSETTVLVSEKNITCSLEDYYTNMVNSCVTVEEDNRIVNAANEMFTKKELVFKNKEGLPVITILKSSEKLTTEQIEGVNKEYQEATSGYKNENREWSELYQKTTGNTAPKNSLI